MISLGRKTRGRGLSTPPNTRIRRVSQGAGRPFLALSFNGRTRRFGRRNPGSIPGRADFLGK